MPAVDCHLVKRALTGEASECGDTGVIVKDGETCFIALVDVLGHGPEAAVVAAQAEAFLLENRRENPADLMRELHLHLKGSRGAVAFLGLLDLPTGEFRCCGIGNISAKVFGTEDPRRLLSKDGVVGYIMSTPREQTLRLLPRDIVMLCSDGLRDHFEVLEHPGLLRGSAEAVAGNMLSQFSKGDDDASCLVMRYLK